MRFSPWSPRSAAAMALAAGLLAAPAVLADTRSVRDPARDVDRGFGWVDIRKATAGHASGGRLRHVVHVRRPNRNTAQFTGLRLAVPGGARYAAGGLLSPGKVKNLGTGEVTGDVSVRRRGKRIVLVFHRRALGSPSVYGWRAQIIGGTGDGGVRDADIAPDRRSKRHRLSR